MDMAGPPSESLGIYSVEFDAESGKFVDGTLKLRADAGQGAQGSPSWLRWHPKGLPVLYTNNETLSTEQGPGSVTAYAVRAGTGGIQLALLSRLSTKGSSPCYVDIHPEGTHLAVANYSLDEVRAHKCCVLSHELCASWLYLDCRVWQGGSVAIMSLDPRTGDLVGQTCWVQQEQATEPHITALRAGIDEGLGIPMATPHTHSALFDSSGSWLFVGDVGNDRVTVYSFDQSTGKLTKHNEALVTPLVRISNFVLPYP